jgi:hypothetical protein
MTDHERRVFIDGARRQFRARPREKRRAMSREEAYIRGALWAFNVCILKGERIEKEKAR